MHHPIDEDTAFEASKLGTKQYWEDAYQVELNNFEEFGDEGEIWFGKQCEKRIVEWCSKNFSVESVRTLDIGSGNGHMLLSLSKKGFTNLYGIDYSENAVKLGQALFGQHEELPQASFNQLDFLHPDPAWTGSHSFDLMIDKGTFDAISLMPSEDPSFDRKAHIENLSLGFKATLGSVWASQDSRFVITSCNWTRAELESMFAPEFVTVHQIEHPAFSFGGTSGQVVTTLVFSKSSPQ